MATRTVLRSNGVGQPISVRSSRMRWARVSIPFLKMFLDGPPPWHSRAQIAAAMRELNRKEATDGAG